MSDRDKGKPSKSVMGNLPSTRPTRMGRRRDGEPAATAKPEPRPAAKATPKVAKPKRATAAPTPKAGAKAETKRARPRAVRSGSPSLDAAKKPPKPPRSQPAPTPPSGTELVTTAVQATGELAKIGITLGGQALKRAVDRLPKP